MQSPLFEFLEVGAPVLVYAIHDYSIKCGLFLLVLAVAVEVGEVVLRF